MPGKSNTFNPAQQKPNIKYQKKGTFYDKNGKPLPSGKLPEAHIPKTEYNPDIMPKF